MKLLKQNGAEWKYELKQTEGLLLISLVNDFPLAAAATVKIARGSADPKTAERERWLNESLAQHRRELKREAEKLLSARLKAGKNSWRLSLNLEGREVLLQLLNDVRVESWRALGEPEDINTLPPQPSEADLRHHQFMHLAGYFEFHMIDS
jgi:hypothetical protein